MPVVPAGRLVPEPSGSVVDVVGELERLRAGVRAHRTATVATTPVGGVRRQDRLLWGLVPDDEPEIEGDDDGEE